MNEHLCKEDFAIAYVVSNFEATKGATPGIARKIEGQVRALAQSFKRVDLVAVPTRTSVVCKIARRLPFIGDFIQWDPALVSEYDCLYIRRPQYVSSRFLSFLREVKAVGRCKCILYEVPTFPYDEEEKTLFNYPLLIKDRIGRKRLVKYVDRIVDLSQTERVFDIPTVQIINGIDLNTVKAKKPLANTTTSNAINIIFCCASFARYHGADRAVLGLAQYYARKPCRDVYLHLVGAGSEIPSLKEMVKQHSLDDRVIFHGLCDVKTLDSIYDSCGIAIASLGLHRIGVTIASTLKSREYLAKGIPFVYSGYVDVFLNNPVDFCMSVEADDSPLDYIKLVSFYDQLYAAESERDLIMRIRGYAKSHVSADIAMDSVKTFLKDGYCND